MIQNGADPSFKDNDGFSLLHWAAQDGNTSLIIKLLSLGLDVDSTNNGGFTPLMTAVLNDKQNAFDILIQNGADPSFKDNNGFSVLHCAAEGGIPPLSSSCYHLVLTLIQGTMVVSLH